MVFVFLINIVLGTWEIEEWAFDKAKIIKYHNIQIVNCKGNWSEMVSLFPGLINNMQVYVFLPESGSWH